MTKPSVLSMQKDANDAVNADARAESARIVGLSLEYRGLSTGSTEIEIERRRALADLLDQNSFYLPDIAGPYSLSLSLANDIFTINANCLGASRMHSIAVELGALQAALTDYAKHCDDFYKSARTGQIARLESIDAERRKLHEASAAMIREKLAGQAVMDIYTAQRLFTLLYVLHMKNS